jgi:Tol biopolymer transport system component
MSGKNYGVWLALLILLVGCSTDNSEKNAGESTAAQEENVSDANEEDTNNGEVEEESTASTSLDVLDLTGKLYYLALVGDRQQLLSLDLTSGEEEVVFAVPEFGWLSGAAVSPDGEQIVLSYSAPPEEGQVQFGFTDLYLMPADGSKEPTALIRKEDPSEAFFNVSWPIDDTIYYAHVAPNVDESGVVLYRSQIERIDISSGERELVDEGAAWPRMADDRSALAFVNDELELIVSAIDGSDPEIILDSNRFTAIDAPLISPGNDKVCFSAVNPQPESTGLIWDRLLGVNKAEAHGVPSDWWCLSLDGSEDLVRLTNLNALGLYGDFSEDGSYLAFISSDGVYIMRSDGSDLQSIRDINAFGTLEWVP